MVEHERRSKKNKNDINSRILALEEDKDQSIKFDDSNPRHNGLRAIAGASVKVKHHFSIKRKLLNGNDSDPADRSLSRRSEWFKILPQQNKNTITDLMPIEENKNEDQFIVIKLLIVGMDESGISTVVDLYGATPV